MRLSPLPSQQSRPVSPSLSPRKRSIHEVDDGAVSSPNPKRALTDYANENQENRDPALSIPTKDTSIPEKQILVLPPPPSVEVIVKRSDLTMPSESDRNSPVRVPSSETDHLNHQQPGSPTKSDLDSAPAAKKRKLSPASKDAKQQEKEAREHQKLEEKAKKDEEKARKEEEKRLRVEEKKKRDTEREEEKRVKEEERKKREAEREEEKRLRDEKKKAKDEEKAAKEAAKEEEKRRREEEKLKKERAQPKLNSFFTKPPLPSTTPQTGNAASPKKPTPSAELQTINLCNPPKSDYEKTFPDFFLQSHTQLAPSNRFERDPEALKHVRQTIDASLDPSNSTPYPHLPFRPSDIFHIIPFRRRCGRPTHSVREILLRMQNAGDDSAMELEGNAQAKTAEDVHDILRQIPMKSLRFGEDVRPPYQGTFTRPVPEASAKKLSRNPYHRGLPDINYDYDSEVEWEEPEEGEDLDSEEDEEGSDDGDDDMDGFLDDEEDTLLGGKRRLLVGDLEPVSSGIRWAADGVDPEWKAYQIETISATVRFPINPFSDAYWQKPKPAEPVSVKARVGPAGKKTLDAFRINPAPDTPAIGAAPPAATTKAKRPFPPEHLEEFKQVVEGSDLSKIGVIEILKKRFPKVSKDTLKATLDQVAVRVGQKEVDKKWVCR
ncbi:uncharacterized protein N7482_002677 [Penicillium canariense]|uniref:Chromatin assembly factor 1 subunit A n=1 Tax=Penicillium canariense TaxID=189055 RepID=A0A9W9IJ89_9EURO|nr:uncharacterized protein N7482_002677 [Penicillium canariense]KAJ5176800.1 hypothetical protein N7482_002677 [Penicillium canariense]